MTSFLIKLFIKDYENIGNSKVRENYGLLGSFVGIFSNTLLFAVKIIIGTLLNSIAITADSFNNLSDSASSVITLIGFKMGNKPADDEHPYGHGRMEYISALAVSFIILLLGFEFFKTSVEKILNPDDITFRWISVLILFLTVIVKVWQGLFNKSLGKKINSQSLIATGADSMNDVVVTSATILSLFISKFTGLAVDGWFGVLVALFLMYSGFSLARETLSPLIGEATDSELAEKIKKIVLEYDGVLGTHDLMVHNYGPNKSLASIHVEVPYDVDINVSHEIIDKIEKDVLKRTGIFLVIHMDPVDTKDERLSAISRTIKEYLSGLDEYFDAHDFRIVDGINNINIIFDLVVLYKCCPEKQSAVLDEVKKRIRSLDERYTCVINIDKSYQKID